MNNTTWQTPGIANTPSGAAIQRYKIGYRLEEWGQRSRTPSGIPDASGSWVRYADHVNALAAGQATAAQAVVQDDLITLRKPTTSAELLWLLKLAHLVISEVDKTLEETFSPAQPAAEPAKPIGYLNPKMLGPDGKIDAPGALTYSSRPCGGWTFPIYAAAPAQPAVEASRFGSPELQAMIIARCVEKDQAESVQEDALDALDAEVLRDAERYRFIRDVPYSDDVRSVLVHQQNAAMDRVIDAARKQGASHDR